MVEAQLTALRDVIQEDPGGRGLRTDPESNLISACAGDFAAACRSIAVAESPRIAVVTGFFIPTAEPPTAETDGPLGALFLAITKRRAEVNLLQEGAANHRSTLALYTPALVDQMTSMVTASTVISYALYTFTAENLPTNHAMMLTIPFVAYGVFRYLFLSLRRRVAA